ncbi:CHAT domain-containing protein [Scytonema sp. UIC 10036]|uniref:GUN4 domain-containing protein n=1 Tax=Scytonema sp. UIC 10036 TaxID=2304196 RepID=UPI0012DA8AD3|nr:GUN4 domain-containing protein [Scytonema sp. UIC 10036]MUG92504.1 CHAT domain-containing protein [Scytonema sp. UIC 10036]
MNLTGQQRKRLRDALISAFPDRSSLEQLLDFELNKKLNQITQDTNLQTVVFQLIQRAEAEGWVVDLIRAARKENPGNSELQAIARELLSPEPHTVPEEKPKAPVSLPEPSTEQQKILILAANPKGTSQLRLDEEVREIEQGLQRARQRERFEIKSELAVRPRDIHRSILDFKPNIVHFSGHGAGQDGLIFEDESGQAKLVDALALARLFKLFANRVKCVVLNACYSEIQAKAIAQHIDYVIGMSPAVGDKVAIEFAVGFYDALGAGESIEFAHELGCTLIQIQGFAEELTPKLLDKKQIVDSPSANEQDFNPQTNEVTETRSTIVTEGLDDDLSSEKGIDYNKLRDFLKEGQWKQADEETLAVMLKASGGEEGWLNVEFIENFPCTDLRIVDQLWVKYSDRRFGFSVQKLIWESVGQDYEKFGDRIGWRNKEKWLEDISLLTFDLKAPSGHLPCSAVWSLARTRSITERAWKSFFSRVEKCRL